MQSFSAGVVEVPDSRDDRVAKRKRQQGGPSSPVVEDGGVVCIDDSPVNPAKRARVSGAVPPPSPSGAVVVAAEQPSSPLVVDVDEAAESVPNPVVDLEDPLQAPAELAVSSETPSQSSESVLLVSDDRPQGRSATPPARDPAVQVVMEPTLPELYRFESMMTSNIYAQAMSAGLPENHPGPLFLGDLQAPSAGYGAHPNHHNIAPLDLGPGVVDASPNAGSEVLRRESLDGPQRPNDGNGLHNTRAHEGASSAARNLSNFGLDVAPTVENTSSFFRSMGNTRDSRSRNTRGRSRSDWDPLTGHVTLPPRNWNGGIPVDDDDDDDDDDLSVRDTRRSRASEEVVNVDWLSQRLPPLVSSGLRVGSSAPTASMAASSRLPAPHGVIDLEHPASTLQNSPGSLRVRTRENSSGPGRSAEPSIRQRSANLPRQQNGIAGRSRASAGAPNVTVSSLLSPAGGPAPRFGRTVPGPSSSRGRALGSIGALVNGATRQPNRRDAGGGLRRNNDHAPREPGRLSEFGLEAYTVAVEDRARRVSSLLANAQHRLRGPAGRSRHELMQNLIAISMRARGLAPSMSSASAFGGMSGVPFGIPGPSQELSYEEMLALDDAVVNVRAASKRDIAKLPVRTATASDKEIRCCICMCDVGEGEELRILPCKHELHRDCVDAWLERNGSCPIDKKRVC